MYDIGIPEITCTEKLEDTQHTSIKYIAHATNPLQFCPNPDCEHKHKLHKHSTQKNLLRDTMSEGKLVFIELSIQRYRCPDCGTISRDQFSFYDLYSHITNRLKNEFIRRCLNGETFSYIANDYNVDHKTVATIYKKYINLHIDTIKTI